MADAQGTGAILDAILPFLQTKAKGVSIFKEELQSYSHIGDTIFFSDSCRKKLQETMNRKMCRLSLQCSQCFQEKTSCATADYKNEAMRSQELISVIVYTITWHLLVPPNHSTSSSSTIMTHPRDLDFSFFLGKRKEELFQPPWTHNYVTFFFTSEIQPKEIWARTSLDWDEEIIVFWSLIYWHDSIFLY